MVRVHECFVHSCHILDTKQQIFNNGLFEHSFLAPKYMLNFWRFLDVHVFVLKSNSVTKTFFTYVYSYLLHDKIHEKGATYVYLISMGYCTMIARYDANRI